MKILKTWETVNGHCKVVKVRKNSEWRFWESPVFQVYNKKEIILETTSCGSALEAFSGVCKQDVLEHFKSLVDKNSSN